MNYFHRPSILLLFLLLSNYIQWINADQANLTDSVKELVTNEEVTEEQVKKWWYHTQAKRRGHPRTFPFCFDTKQPLPGKVEKFRTIMEKLNDFTEYDPDMVGWPSTENAGLYEMVQLVILLNHFFLAI